MDHTASHITGSSPKADNPGSGLPLFILTAPASPAKSKNLAPDAAASDADRGPGMRSGRQAGNAGDSGLPVPEDKQVIEHYGRLQLRPLDSISDAGAPAGNTPPGFQAGESMFGVQGPLRQPNSGRRLSGADQADASLAGPLHAGSEAPDRNGRKEFARAGHRAGADLRRLENMLGQVCQGRDELALVLADFDREVQPFVLEYLFCQQHWQVLRLDIGKREPGWDYCLQRLSELMAQETQRAGASAPMPIPVPPHGPAEPQLNLPAAEPATSARRSVRLDFGQGSLASMAAPTIFRDQPLCLHGYGELKFCNLDMRNHAMQALVSALNSEAATLRTLTLMQTYFGNQEMAPLFQALADSRSLCQLHLGCYPVRHHVQALADALNRNRSITDLALTAIRPDKAGMEGLLGSLAGRGEWRTLDLSGNNIDADDITAIAVWLEEAGAAVDKMPALEQLRLVDLRIYGNNYDHTFADHARWLIWQNQVGNPWTLAACAALGRMLGKNRQLRELDLNRNPIHGPALECLFGELENNHDLRILRLNGASFTGNAADRLLAIMAVRQAPLLVEIDPGRCSAQALQQLRQLPQNSAALDIEWLVTPGQARTPARLPAKTPVDSRVPTGRRS